ncbi:MAG: hypothetical protein ABSE07_05790 [Methanoregula sp.]|jgi:hypothetical protein
MNNKGKNYDSMGFSYEFEQKVDGKYDVYIYRPFLMESEDEILKTIFHEYGHFIDYCISNGKKQPLKLLYQTDNFRKFHGNYSDDFAELFA